MRTKKEQGRLRQEADPEIKMDYKHDGSKPLGVKPPQMTELQILLLALSENLTESGIKSIKHRDWPDLTIAQQTDCHGLKYATLEDLVRILTLAISQLDRQSPFAIITRRTLGELAGRFRFNNMGVEG